MAYVVSGRMLRDLDELCKHILISHQGLYLLSVNSINYPEADDMFPDGQEPKWSQYFATHQRT